MSWSSSKGRIQGKIASGSFEKKDTTIADGIMAASDIVAGGIMKRAEEERAEKKREKAAAAAEARRLAAEQRKKEEEERQIERQVKAIAARKGIDDKNLEAYTYIRDQVEAFGTSAAALIEKDFDDGKLSLPMVDDMREVQGPDVAPDFKVQVEGIDNPVAVDDLEAISTEMLLPQETREAARLQMDMVAPVSEIPAESVGQTQGFMVDPTAEKVEIDWMDIDNETKVKTLRRMHDSGVQVLSEQDEAILKDYETDLQDARLQQIQKDNREFNQSLLGKGDDELRAITTAGDEVYTPEQRELASAVLEGKALRISAQEQKDAEQEALEFRRSLATMDVEDLKGVVASPDYTAEEKQAAAAQLSARPGEPFDITDYDDVKTETLQTIIDDPSTDPKKVTQLEALVSNRRSMAPRVDPKSEDYLITFIDEAGEKQSTVAKLAADGSGFVDLTTNRPIAPADGTQPVNMAQQGELYDSIVKINTSLIKPLKTQRVGMVTTLASAKKLNDLVESNPEILTIVGGKIPAVLKRVGLETKALTDLFNATGSVDGTLSEIDRRFNVYINDSRLGESARAAALFQAEKIKMGFMFAASSLGQSGQGLSNTDFSRALDVLDQGADYKTFSTNIRRQTQAVIAKTDTMITDFNEDASVQLLRPLDTTGEILAGYRQDAETYATNRGLGEAFAWAMGEDATPQEAGEVTPTQITVPKAAENALLADPNLRDEFDKKYGEGAAAKVLGEQ